MEWWDLLQQEWAIRAFIASTLVGVMCGVLGSFIVLRNMSLIGDALAHAILPGVVFAFMIVGYSALGFFTGAVIAGLLTAVGITWIQQNIHTKNDAAIGIVFTAMFSIGVMGISWISRNEGVHLDLKDFLFGNILGVANEDLYLTAGVAVYVIISIIVFYRYLFVSTFQPVIAQTMGISVQMVHYFLMLLLSFAVVASLQTVGVILVVAMLITPSSTALLLSNRLHWVIFLSGIIGMISAILGLFFSILWETTPGPAMAVTATLIYLLTAFLAPNRGLLARYIQKRNHHKRIRLEDTLKQAFRLQEDGQLQAEHLVGRVGLSKRKTQQNLSRLRKKGFINSTKLELTEKGNEEAQRLVRAHRLWETYLAHKIGLNVEQIHDAAEKYEHLLTDEILDELDQELGYPMQDPHGSPIPSKGQPENPLNSMAVLDHGQIAKQQINEKITAKLWEMGLYPETFFRLQSKTKVELKLLVDQREINLPTGLASKINIQPTTPSD